MDKVSRGQINRVTAKESAVVGTLELVKNIGADRGERILVIEKKIDDRLPVFASHLVAVP